MADELFCSGVNERWTMNTEQGSGKMADELFCSGVNERWTMNTEHGSGKMGHELFCSGVNERWTMNTEHGSVKIEGKWFEFRVQEPGKTTRFTQTLEPDRFLNCRFRSLTKVQVPELWEFLTTESIFTLQKRWRWQKIWKTAFLSKRWRSPSIPDFFRVSHTPE